MELVGYCTIKKEATTGRSAISMDNFLGKDVRVMEFASDGGVMVVDSQAKGIAMFDKQDVYRSFECRELGDIVMPANLNTIEQFEYSARCMSRKGGYNRLLRNMVVEASLMRGKFTDAFLWQKQ